MKQGRGDEGGAAECPAKGADVPAKKRVEIWTDGSHIKGTAKMGFGIYVRVGAREGEVSISAPPSYLRAMLGAGDASVPSNPTVELAAAVVAIERLAPFADAVAHVTLYADYNGVMNYANGVWDARRASAKTPTFAAAARRLQKAAAELRERVPVDAVWVPGHSGDAGNDRADLLAKAGDGRDTFDGAFQ